MSINEKLNTDGIREFDKLVMDNLYDRSWCEANGIDYVSPNITKVEEKTYNELVEFDLIKEQYRRNSIDVK